MDVGSALRVDGRREHEARVCRGSCGTSVHTSASEVAADGMASFAMGGTRAIAHVHGPSQCGDRRSERQDSCVVAVSCATAPFASSDRKKHSKHERAEVEAESALTHALEAVVLCSRLPRSCVTVRITLLQIDGSARACALNAASLALLDAGVPVRGIAAACGACLAHGREMLDPCGAEAAAASTEVMLCCIPSNAAAIAASTPSSSSVTDTAAGALASSEQADEEAVVSVHMNGRCTQSLYERLQKKALNGCAQAAGTIRSAALSRMTQLHASAAAIMAEE